MLVLGGSQGAQVFSTVVPEAIGLLPEQMRIRLRISQQCRPELLDVTSTLYRELGVDAELSSFFDDIPDRLLAAHLVIARAGASTVAELATTGRPAILVPYPYAIDDHQRANATAIDASGGGWMIEQQTLSADLLAARVQSVLTAPEVLTAASAALRTIAAPDAADRFAELVCSKVPIAGGCMSAERPTEEPA
ncbi:MAG: hypothetical protein HC834_00645 [Rhodospirillales bacterium]|nr:hypothetical protein [Rhodospirillales bacterium]